MNAAALRQLSERFGLSAGVLEQLEILAHLLAGDPAAPTTVRDPIGVLNDHLADSLVGLDLDIIRGAERLVDIGTGAGLPGLPLAAAVPAAHVELVEGNGRKCEFIARTAEMMGLSNIRVRHARAEELADRCGHFDIVTARALAPLDVVAEYAAPLLQVGGHLVAWRGKRDAELESAGARAAEILGLSVLEPVRVRPYPDAEHRYLHLMSKVSATPTRFPRRPGVARKRPLGGSRPAGRCSR